jgi:hypothetical protein
MTTERVDPNDSAVSVGLLFDSISQNTGDIAIGIAGAQELARHGISNCVVLDPFAPRTSAVDMVIVGGGELIRPVGDPFYDQFRLTNGGVLSSVGVWQSAADLEFLNSYDRVTARTRVEADVLRKYASAVEVLPCATTTLESEHYEIPGSEPGEELVGIHVVPHTLAMCPDIIAIIDAIPERKVFIPFTHYNFDDSFMRALPFDRTNSLQLPRLTPLQLHSAIGQMKYVVVSSLHASIFAYSQNVPFASVSQEKVAHYFDDRGLSDFVFASDAALERALGLIRNGHASFESSVARDKVAVHRAYADFAALARRKHDDPTRSANLACEPDANDLKSSEDRVKALFIDQRAQVIISRDAVVSQLARRALDAESGVKMWHLEADRLASEVTELRSAAVSRESLLNARSAFPERVFRAIRRALHRG